MVVMVMVVVRASLDQTPSSGALDQTPWLLVVVVVVVRASLDQIPWWGALDQTPWLEFLSWLELLTNKKRSLFQ